MASWSETTKHEPSSINGGRRYEKPDRVPREQLNLITENSFYAVNKSDVANANSENALDVANRAFEQSKVTGTQVMVGGVFQTTFNADTKANQSDFNKSISDINDNSSNISKLQNDTFEFVEKISINNQWQVPVNVNLSKYEYTIVGDVSSSNGTNNISFRLAYDGTIIPYGGTWSRFYAQRFSDGQNNVGFYPTNFDVNNNAIMLITDVVNNIDYFNRFEFNIKKMQNHDKSRNNLFYTSRSDACYINDWVLSLCSGWAYNNDYTDFTGYINQLILTNGNLDSNQKLNGYIEVYRRKLK